MFSPMSSILHLLPHWKRKNDIESRPLSIFRIITIPAHLIQQSLQRFFHFHNLGISRKINPESYSWFARTCHAFRLEIPCSNLAGTHYSRKFLLQLLAVGCRGPWLKRIRQHIHMRLMLFGLFSIGLAQAIASVRRSGVAGFYFAMGVICS